MKFVLCFFICKNSEKRFKILSSKSTQEREESMPLKLLFVSSRYLDPFPRYNDPKYPWLIRYGYCEIGRPTDLNIFPRNAIFSNYVYRLFGIGQ